MKPWFEAPTDLEIKIEENAESPYNIATINYVERKITFGTNVEKVNEYLLTGTPRPPYNEYTDINDIYIDGIEHLITHEYIHLACYRMGGRKATDGFDEIDKENTISDSNRFI